MESKRRAAVMLPNTEYSSIRRWSRTEKYIFWYPRSPLRIRIAVQVWNRTNTRPPGAQPHAKARTAVIERCKKFARFPNFFF